MFLKENLVSVLMPVYNCEAYVTQAIQSILNQTYQNFELLIVDDGSKDASWKTVTNIKDDRVKKFKFEKNKGNIVALNFLLNKAEGDYITFQDADDWSDKNRLQIQVDFLKQHQQIYLCGTQYSHVEVNGTFTSSAILPLTHNDILNYIDTYKFPSLCAASCMIRKEVYNKIGGLREYYNRIGSGDFDWHYSIIQNFETANINEVLYFYRKNNLSLTTTVSKDLKKMISYKIAYHLYNQRKLTGTDSISNKNFGDIEELTQKLLPQYFKDPKLIYFKIAENQINTNQLRKGFFSIIVCIWKKPFGRRNITLVKMLYKKITTPSIN